MDEILAGHDRLIEVLAGSHGKEEPIGQVCGVYDRVVNLSHCRNGRIFSLLTKDGGEEPWALRTSALSFAQAGVAVGMTLGREGHALHLGEKRIVFCPEDLVDYQIRPWRRGMATDAALPEAVPVLAGLVSQYRPAAAVVAAHEPRFSQLGKVVCQAVQSEDYQAAFAAARAMLGLGPGLTPAGDDWLVGFQAAACLGDTRLAVWPGLFQELIQGAAGRTTDLSLEFLRRAGAGIFGSKLRNALRAVSQGEDLRLPVEALIRTGASSGLDTAKGLLAGLLVMID